MCRVGKLKKMFRICFSPLGYFFSYEKVWVHHRNLDLAKDALSCVTWATRVWGLKNHATLVPMWIFSTFARVMVSSMDRVKFGLSVAYKQLWKHVPIYLSIFLAHSRSHTNKQTNTNMRTFSNTHTTHTHTTYNVLFQGPCQAIGTTDGRPSWRCSQKQSHIYTANT